MRIYTIILISLIIGCTNSNETKTEAAKSPTSKEADKIELGYPILSREDLELSSLQELRIIRNEVFARHGYIFNSVDLDSIFKTKEWYTPSKKVVLSELNQMEKDYISLIKEVEQRRTKKVTTCSVVAEVSSILETITLPSRIADIIEVFGYPDSTFIDDDTGCPIGQLHFWLSNGLIVNEDNYSLEVTFETESRVFCLTEGQLIGLDKDEIETILISEQLKYNYRTGTNVLERFLANKNSGRFLFEYENKFITIRLGANNRVQYILVSTFNVNLAC